MKDLYGFGYFPNLQTTQLLNICAKLGILARQLKGNDNYWNTLNRSTNYTLAFVVGSDYDLLLRVDKGVSIDAAVDVQEGLDTEVDWLVSCKWSDIEVPSTSDVPAGIFE